MLNEFRKCCFCGNEFAINEFRKKKKIYCSKRCGHQYRTLRKNPTDKVCPQCGVMFCKYPLLIQSNRKYCSEKCLIKYHYKYKLVEKSIINKICPRCNKEFQTTNKKKRYCNRKCLSKEHKEKMKINLKINRIIKCPICGNEYSPLIRSHIIYCSIRCYKKSKIEKDKIIAKQQRRDLSEVYIYNLIKSKYNLHREDIPISFIQTYREYIKSKRILWEVKHA